MTAILGALNKHAVAIAADSALTINNKKVFNNTDKLFTLSKHAPVAIAFYNNVLLENVPWEILIKEYRKQLGTKKFSKLSAYADDFFSFLKKHKYFMEEESHKRYVCDRLKITIDRCLQNLQVPLDESANVRLTQSVQILRLANKKNLLDESITDKKFTAFYSSELNEVIKYCQGKYGNGINVQLVRELLFLHCSYICPVDEFYTGLLFAGYGESEIYPSILRYGISGIFCSTLKIQHTEADDVHISATNDASIIPCAQTDVALTFLTGVAPVVKNIYLRQLTNVVNNIYKNMVTKFEEIEGDETKVDAWKQTISSIFDIKLIKDQYNTSNDSEIRQTYIQPFISTVGALEKAELAELAETIVRLTSLRRKISVDQSSVGGPIDVMVISKGDGAVWIKRKLYFDAEINRPFFETYLEH